MIHYIYLDRSGHKKARPVKNRKEYFAIRNCEANVRNFEAARGGDKKAKMRLKQFNYNDLLPEGVLKGCCHTASTFAHDIDCGGEEACHETAQRLLAKKDCWNSACRAAGDCMPSVVASRARPSLRIRYGCR